MDNIYELRRDAFVRQWCEKRKLGGFGELSVELLPPAEYESFRSRMAESAELLLPNEQGSVIEKVFAPPLLVRRQWLLKAVRNAYLAGTRQLITINSGLDSFGLLAGMLFPQLKVIEFEQADVCREKRERLGSSGVSIGENYELCPAAPDWEKNLAASELFAPSSIAVVSLLGYGDETPEVSTARRLAEYLPVGSSFCFTLSEPKRTPRKPETQLLYSLAFAEGGLEIYLDDNAADFARTAEPKVDFSDTALRLLLAVKQK